ncbi:zona pellucida-like domain-containing protein 1 [Betta splendens]|uniref:Zona pellucida-like domain-containing protein 1 n=1 Tax=Betta splendens TaxID=158456 RepID=A0A6P7P531_BETSP|nr:zona pellucida-like domain-containing protein 1 [Betta splendens]
MFVVQIMLLWVEERVPFYAHLSINRDDVESGTAAPNMKTNRLRTARLILLVFQLGLILRAEAQVPNACIASETNRAPDYGDINVSCGTQSIDLSILLCPVYNALYNESLLVLNNQFSKAGCFGTPDWTAVPPVLRFKIPLNETSVTACGNSFKITSDVGNGLFSDFSSVQNVNISGLVNSNDPTGGTITYRSQLLYRFSCYYPLQYLLNNTQLGVSGVNVAVRDNNGSFISTLSMQLYKDSLYQEPLIIPQSGLSLKTKIYVSVKATNLTNRFNVLLDRCYATTSPYPSFAVFYDLFVGCTRDAQTKIDLNGVSQRAAFSFEAFRFIEHKNVTVSTFYLHCATRLCEVSTCSSLLPVCSGRRKREVQGGLPNATVTSAAIYVGQVNEGGALTTVVPTGGTNGTTYSSPMVAVIICIVILTIVIIVMAWYFVFVIGRRKQPRH